MSLPMPKKFVYPGPEAGYSYHNHSNWSDGADSMENMCRSAKKAGLREFGLSDHFVMHPDPAEKDISWALLAEKLTDYISALQKLKAELDDENFTLRIGLEIDYFAENIEQVVEYLKPFPIDYLIGSVHYVGRFPVDHSAPPWERLSADEKEEICQEYWKKVLGAAECGKFLFLGHLDLIKKFALIDNMERFLPHAEKVLDAASRTGTAIELNTSGWFKPCNEQYPSDDILRAAQKRGVPVVINPDAHEAAHVDRNFKIADDLLKSLGFPR